jgi:predicted phosphodiesterase
LKFGILSDLHLGHTGVGLWHNRLLFDQAEEIARAAVTALNAREPDIVFVLGDITEAGEEGQIAKAKAILSELEASWFVLPGNHDRPAVRSGLFDTAFRGRLVPDFIQHDGLVIAGLRERVPESEDGEASSFKLDAKQATMLLERLKRTHPEVLLLFSHFPLADESAWAAHHAGKAAGSFENGEAFLARAASLVEWHAAAFCGHQHWHHVTSGPAWTQCATAALIEYPLEVRMATLEGRNLRIETLPAVSDPLAQTSLNGAGWVRGRTEDRHASIMLHEEDESDLP